MNVAVRDLDRKLAEWAGFKRVNPYRDYDWVTPDGQPAFLGDHNGYFTKDLSACFRWLVPKLGNRVEVKFRHGYPCIDTLTCEVWPHGPNGTLQEADVFVQTTLSYPPGYFALALCLAIEKLIDWKE